MRTIDWRTTGERSRILVAIVAIAVTFGLAGSAFAGSGDAIQAVHKGAKLAKPIKLHDDARLPKEGAPVAATSTFAAPPANDTCAGAIPLPLNITVLASTVGATDDFQSPADTTCFSQLGHTPTTAPGRDVVYTFTASNEGNYTVRIVQQGPNDDQTRVQNAVLYASDTCPGSGVVNCLPGGGANGPQSNLAVGSNTGLSSNQSEEISCLPLAAGQTIYVFLDNAQPNNAGSNTSLEAIPCNSEVEPNDTTATASAFFCGIAGSSNAVPTAHCYLGSKAGQQCTRSAPLDPTFKNCSLFPDKRCNTDADCLAGEGTCVVPVDLDCDSRCDVGPNAGQLCTATLFCNPVSDQGAVCAGTCQIESTCIDDATGTDTGTPCTPICVGGLFPGRYCSSITGCPGGGVCTVSAGCPAGQTCGRQYNEGDVDFYSLGTPVTGSKVFATVDARGSTDFDFRMRITSDNATFQFDDDDGIGRNGSNAPVIAGAVTDGNPAYIKVSKTTPRISSPYEIQAIVRGPLATAQLEDESGPNGNDIIYYWPANVINANAVTNGGYVRGAFNFQGDSDCFKFLVNEGDLMQWWGDGNPTRAPGGIGITNVPQMILFDSEHAAIENFAFGMAPGRRNITPNAAQPTTNGLSPAVLSFYLEWRATYTGMLNVCFYDASTLIGLGTPAPYPSAYAGSLSANCGPVQNAGPGTTTADVSLTKTGPAGPLQAGQFVDYVITVTNNGTEIAQEITLSDTLDPNLSFVSLTVDDGLGGENTACFSLPNQGTADAPIDCINTSMVPGSTTTYTLTVQVNNCIGAGINIDNTASITTVSTDPDPANDQATASVTTSDDGSCVDIACDGLTCVPDLCTDNDHCDAGVCVSTPINCDDGSVCTDDSCDPAVGCVNDSTLSGDTCDDFNDCTANMCDPIAFCVFPPEALGTGCNDGLTCTVTDQCDGQGSCAGTSVCDDSDPCTDDLADELDACACTHPPAAAGVACDDDDACTGTVAAADACNGAGACAGGQAVVCDDGDACTTDSCDPSLGCVFVPLTCDDNNVCNGAETCDTATGCVAGTPLACSDGDACNGAETCDPVNGCGPGTPLNCDDGSVCTGTETCNPASGCVAGTPLNCDDGNLCTGLETCNPATGCVAGTPVGCTASDQCHNAGICNPGTGVCSDPPKPSGTACADGNPCTTGDTCNATGACVGGPAPTCPDDGDACTAETCDPATGCVGSVANFDVAGFSATRVDGRDLVILADAWNSCLGNPNYDAAANLDHVGCVDLDDFHLFMNTFGRSCQ